MAYLLQKYKNIICLVLLLVFILGVWYILINKNINFIPEKANLVLTFFNIARNV